MPSVSGDTNGIESESTGKSEFERAEKAMEAQFELDLGGGGRTTCRICRRITCHHGSCRDYSFRRN
jgi:hypothetical protein